LQILNKLTAALAVLLHKKQLLSTYLMHSLQLKSSGNDYSFPVSIL